MDINVDGLINRITKKIQIVGMAENAKNCPDKERDIYSFEECVEK